MQAFAATEDNEGEQWTLRDAPAQLIAESPSYTLYCSLDTTIAHTNSQSTTKISLNKWIVRMESTLRHRGMTPFPLHRNLFVITLTV